MLNTLLIMSAYTNTHKNDFTYTISKLRRTILRARCSELPHAGSNCRERQEPAPAAHLPKSLVRTWSRGVKIACPKPWSRRSKKACPKPCWKPWSLGSQKLAKILVETLPQGVPKCLLPFCPFLACGNEQELSKHFWTP